VSTGSILLLSAGVAGGMMFLLWLASIPLRDASIVDPFWGFGFVLVAWAAGLAGDGGASPWTWVLVGLTTVWGLRLSIHLGRRNLGHGEDFRYAEMRRKRERFWLSSLWIVFGLQAALLWLISLPLQLAHAPLADGRSAVLGLLGVAVWAVGLFFEAVGDAQLARFKADPANRGKVLDTGLWRYTRHPNYFGDACVWWGLWLVALAAGAPWWTAVGPLVMTIFLRRVSGVTLLERSLRERRPGYEDYVRRTSPFFPRPPREPGAGTG
jgi:steroid 5-alpha reductase family enzyme